MANKKPKLLYVIHIGCDNKPDVVKSAGKKALRAIVKRMGR